MSQAATAEKTETLYLVWDTCSIAQGQAEYLMEQAKEEGRELSDDEAFQDACGDQDLYDIEWRDLCDNLTKLMNRINPDGYEWHCAVKNFGWRHQDGYKDFRAEDGKKLLQEVLPKTDCTFKIFDNGDHIAINNAHHDAPCGGEMYFIESNRKWVIKALYEADDESGDWLYWSNKDGWVDKNSATIFRDREKKTARLPENMMKLSTADVAEILIDTGEWEEHEE